MDLLLAIIVISMFAMCETAAIDTKNKRLAGCSQPPYIRNTRNDGSRRALTYAGYFRIGSVVHYECEFGYVVLDGAKHLMCAQDASSTRMKWVGESLNCMPVACPKLESDQYTLRNSGCHHFGCESTVYCVRNASVSVNTLCLSTGRWSGRQSFPDCNTN